MIQTAARCPAEIHHIFPLGRGASSSPSAFLLTHHTDDSSFPTKWRARIPEGEASRRGTEGEHQLGFRMAADLWETPWDLSSSSKWLEQCGKMPITDHKVWWMLGRTVLCESEIKSMERVTWNHTPGHLQRSTSRPGLGDLGAKS